MNRTPRSLLSLCVLSVLCGFFAGCGYTTRSQFPENVRTVAVVMFERNKDVYRRDVEIRLTEAIQKRIQQNTPYRLATRGRADTELSGELVKVSQQVLSMDDNGRPHDIEAVLTFNFMWKDKTGKVLMQRERFNVSGTYIPAAPFRENFFVGSEDIINKAARLIVEQMESDW